MDKSVFLSGPRPTVKHVEIDGHSLFIRAMTAGEQMQFQDREAKPSEFVGRLLVASLTDEQGVKILVEDDIPSILEMDAQYLAKVVEAVVKLNGFSPKDMDELEKK